MADISDDEVIEKPKRVMSEKQKEALKKGRELAKANREAQKKPVETKVEEPKNEIIEKPKLKRATKVLHVLLLVSIFYLTLQDFVIHLIDLVLIFVY